MNLEFAGNSSSTSTDTFPVPIFDWTYKENKLFNSAYTAKTYLVPDHMTAYDHSAATFESVLTPSFLLLLSSAFSPPLLLLPRPSLMKLFPFSPASDALSPPSPRTSMSQVGNVHEVHNQRTSHSGWGVGLPFLGIRRNRQDARVENMLKARRSSDACHLRL